MLIGYPNNDINFAIYTTLYYNDKSNNANCYIIISSSISISIGFLLLLTYLLKVTLWNVIILFLCECDILWLFTEHICKINTPIHVRIVLKPNVENKKKANLE